MKKFLNNFLFFIAGIGLSSALLWCFYAGLFDVHEFTSYRDSHIFRESFKKGHPDSILLFTDFPGGLMMDGGSERRGDLCYTSRDRKTLYLAVWHLPNSGDITYLPTPEHKGKAAWDLNQIIFDPPHGSFSQFAKAPIFNTLEDRANAALKAKDKQPQP